VNHRSSSPPRAPCPSGRPLRELGEKQVEALTVAMVVAPGVYVRNRMFDLFTSRGARRARTRAGIVRGIVPQLARASGVTLTGEARGIETTFVLRYAIPSMRLTRVVELSGAELAALRLVAERANIRSLPLGPGDREIVTRSLARLMDCDVSSVDVARLAREVVAPGE